jgi:hypothetical protein
MTTLNSFTNEINSVALFAKRINYNLDNGIDVLMQLWIADCKKTNEFLDSQKEAVVKTIKNIIN